jgi:Asp-tRNA(Asn)/Glu-tRNA(Gln) amidotransferase A subunit family amidase
MVLAWSMDRVGPLCRTAEDAAMVFNTIHGVDAKDPSTITMPFHFNNNIDLSKLRIGVRKQTSTTDHYFPAFIEKLKSLGAKPVDLGDPPTVAGSSGGLDVESAAAFDTYVQRKAKELNMDMAAIIAEYGTPPGRRGGAGAPGGRGAPGAPPAPGGAGRGASANTGSGPTSGQLNRWVPGRLPTAFEFINSQRRRLMLITAWQDYLKDTDLYLGASDTGVHAQTGHPVVVVQMGFGQRPVGQGRGGAAPAPTTPSVPLHDQPICTQIAGNLYNDDMILSVAHKFQMNTDFHTHRPILA